MSSCIFDYPPKIKIGHASLRTRIETKFNLNRNYIWFHKITKKFER